MDATTEATVVERTLSIAASPETVWDFFVDPQKATRWMGFSIDLDPRPGGIYRNEVLPGHVARGEFVELDPPRRLVFTWGWEKSGEGPITVPAGSSTIEIELAPDGDRTTVHFVHRDLPTTDAAQAHGHGWDHYLSRLEIAAAGGDPGADPWLTEGMS
jgi:uncharacterized protein YndB with AHSA1/START domain